MALVQASSVKQAAPAPYAAVATGTKQLVVASPELVKARLGVSIKDMQIFQATACALAGSNTNECVKNIQNLAGAALGADVERQTYVKDQKKTMLQLARETQEVLATTRAIEPIQKSVNSLASNAIENANERDLLLDGRKKHIMSLVTTATRLAQTPQVDIYFCQDIIQQLGSLALEIAQVRDELKAQESSKEANSSTTRSSPIATNQTAEEREVRIQQLQKGLPKPFSDLPSIQQQFDDLICNPNPTLTLEQQNAAVSGLMQTWNSNLESLQGNITKAAGDIRKIIWRQDAVVTLFNNSIAAQWEIQSLYLFLGQLLDLRTRESRLLKEVMESTSPDLQAFQTRAASLRKDYDAFQAKVTELRANPLPDMHEFYTYADAQSRPTTVDKAAPEFENIKVENIKQPILLCTNRVKEKADEFCRQILDTRIGYVLKLLELSKEPQPELAQMLKADLEARLPFLTANVAALSTPSNVQMIQNLLAQAAEMKKAAAKVEKLPPTFADGFNAALIQLRAKEAELVAVEFAAQFNSQLETVRGAFEALKSKVAEKSKPVLAKEELAAAVALHRGLGTDSTFEGQFEKLVSLNEALKLQLKGAYKGGETAWLADDKARCLLTPELDASLTRKLKGQYTASQAEFEKQRAALTLKWNELSKIVKEQLSQPLNVMEDSIRAHEPRTSYISGWRACTRYTQWWDNGPTQAPRRALETAPAASSPSPAASPELEHAAAPAANSSPSNSTVAPAAAPAASSPSPTASLDKKPE